jgi:cyclopropane-fatty-acyl-phospholipid synthase
VSQLEPFYENVQAHYDLSDEFFKLFLDPSMTYSCAYFERDDMTLEEAQLAKIDLSLGKCDLRPGLTLLDIGCGWGATARRAATKYHANVIGLTLSENQHRHDVESVRALPSPPEAGRVEFRLQGWEEFEPALESAARTYIDRIVSIGAFEHFRAERWPAFFAKCKRLLDRASDGGGRMLLHTIVLPDAQTLKDRGIEVRHEHVVFAKFIRKYIFPGGQLPMPSQVIRHATDAGFKVDRVHPLQLHYARTLETWAANLSAAREKAIAIASQDVYALYMKYLTGCAAHFRSGHLDVVQFTLVA